MKTVEPTTRHIECMKKLRAALDPELTPEEMLGLVCQLVGNLVALQDQRKYSAKAVMEMVAQNIQVGNQEAIREVSSAGGAKN